MESNRSKDKNRERPRILILNSRYVVDDPRGYNQGASLVRLGYDVRAVGIALSGGVPEREDAAGIEVITTPWIASRNPLIWLQECWRLLRGNTQSVTEKYTFRHGIPILSAFFSNLWMLRFGLSGRYDAIYLHEHRVVIAGWILALRHRAPLVHDSYEDMPRFLVGFKRRIAIFQEHLLFRTCAAIVCASDGRARILRERGARRLVVVGNWRRLDDFDIDPTRLETERKRLGLDSATLIIVYVGALFPEREIPPLLEAIKQSPDVALIIGGTGTLADAVAEAAQNAPNIHWLEWVRLADVPLYTMLADVVYYCVDPNAPVMQTVIPNKLFEAFAGGKALLARRGVGEIGEVLEDVPAAILLDDVTPETLKAAFEQLKNPETLKTLQQNAFAVREQYSWEIAEQRLKDLFGELTGQNDR